MSKRALPTFNPSTFQVHYGAPQAAAVALRHEEYEFAEYQRAQREALAPFKASIQLRKALLMTPTEIDRDTSEMLCEAVRVRQDVQTGGNIALTRLCAAIVKDKRNRCRAVVGIKTKTPHNCGWRGPWSTLKRNDKPAPLAFEGLTFCSTHAGWYAKDNSHDWFFEQLLEWLAFDLEAEVPMADDAGDAQPPALKRRAIELVAPRVDISVSAPSANISVSEAHAEVDQRAGGDVDVAELDEFLSSEVEFGSPMSVDGERAYEDHLDGVPALPQ